MISWPIITTAAGKLMKQNEEMKKNQSELGKQQILCCLFSVSLFIPVSVKSTLCQRLVLH